MKKFALLLIITPFILSSCASMVAGHSVYFDIELNKVKLNGEAVNDSISTMMFEDSNISISFTRELSNLSFYLVNKTKQTLTLVWDKSSFVNHLGETEGLIHKGIKLVDKNNPQKNTNIPPLAFFNDMAMPVSAPFMNSIYSGWQYRFLYMWQYPTKEAANKDAEQLNGKTTRLILHMTQDNNVLEYDFNFILLNPSQGNNVNTNNIGKNK